MPTAPCFLLLPPHLSIHTHTISPKIYLPLLLLHHLSLVHLMSSRGPWHTAEIKGKRNIKSSCEWNEKVNLKLSLKLQLKRRGWFNTVPSKSTRPRREREKVSGRDSFMPRLLMHSWKVFFFNLQVTHITELSRTVSSSQYVMLVSISCLAKQLMFEKWLQIAKIRNVMSIQHILYIISDFSAL